MNRDAMRQAVRDQVEQDESDLPNSRLDGYIREGYERVIQLETRWPFFEKLWTLPVSAATASVTVPSDVAIVVAITVPTGRLKWLEHRDGEDWYGFTSVTPGTICHWSKLGTSIYLWPAPSTDVSLTVRGFRRPTDWITSGAEADADERLHWPIVNYALSRVYMQQEDEVLSSQYIADFREGVMVAHRAVMRPWREETLILGGRHQRTQFSPAGNLALITPNDVDGGSP